MRQVLDIFDLLSDGPEGKQGVEWKLVKASTNSPFYAEGEAVSLEPAVDVSVVARAQKQFVANGLKEIAEGTIPDTWDAKRLNIAKRLYRRNLNGVGTTDIVFDNVGSVLVTPRFAERAVSALNAKPSLGLFDLPKVREEIGSLEGVFSDLSTYYNQPAIAVIDSRTETKIWCVISNDLLLKFSDKATIEDFWKKSRVIVRGCIRYNAAGSIQSVIANDISRIESRIVPTSKIRDADFTLGLTTSEYLDRFRDGLIGR